MLWFSEILPLTAVQAGPFEPQKKMRKNLIPLFFCIAAFALSAYCGAGVPAPGGGMAITRPAFALSAGPVKVDFASGADWQQDSQSPEPGWSGRNQTSFNTCAPGFSCNGLSMYTRQGSRDRVKYFSKVLNFSYGSYTWRLYVPAVPAAGERFSIGAFLRSNDDSRELDFEIGYGTSAERAEYNEHFSGELGPDDLLLYSTNQGLTNRGWVQDYCGAAECARRDDAAKTVTVVSPSLADSQSQMVCSKKKIRPGMWHDLTISFARIDDNRSRVSWYVSSELVQTVIVDFGMCSFQAYCSVENLNFIGDRATTADRYGFFAWIEYVPGNDLISGM